MKVKLNDNETYYRHVVFSIGIAMLVLLLLMDLAGFAKNAFQDILREIVFDPIIQEVAARLFYSILYLIVFMLPAAVLKFFLQTRGFSYYPMKAELRVSRRLPILLLGGVFLIWTQSYINGALVNVFNYSSFSSDVLWKQEEMKYWYQIVLQLLVAAFVPAFCEEFLFRGAVLTNLLPFGRTSAVMISALLFALMHRNAEQILYAFAAGILLGLVYERTGSIWNCFFLHLANNFSSVISDVLTLRLDLSDELWWELLKIALSVVCFGCVALLTAIIAKPSINFGEPFWGRSLSATDDVATHPISGSQAIRLFLNLPMILFLALCAAQMIALIVMAWGYSYGT